MTFQERAYAIMVSCLAASWIEDSNGKMRPKAIKLRNHLAKVLEQEYKRGVAAATKHERQFPGENG